MEIRGWCIMHNKEGGGVRGKYFTDTVQIKLFRSYNDAEKDRFRIANFNSYHVREIVLEIG